jgi:hypothetical protein
MMADRKSDRGLERVSRKSAAVEDEPQQVKDSESLEKSKARRLVEDEPRHFSCHPVRTGHGSRA